MTDRPTLQRNFSLRSHNSFGIDAKAAAYFCAGSLDDLQAIRRDETWMQGPRLILGGGSNILFTQDFPGLVLHMGNQGIEIVGEDSLATYVRAAAGVRWHRLVQWTLDQGLGGLENLALIPGDVGAAPIQNIGAYGAELKDFFHSLTAFDMESGHCIVLNRTDCRFGYRDSVFKHALRERAVIMDVSFALPKQWQPNLSYAELAHCSALAGLSVPTASEIGAAVVALRRSKLPDPVTTGNAGSFFKNPVISRSRSDALAAQHPDLARYPQADGRVKLAAAWLIEACGWKGRDLGLAGVYEKHALVLVNRGGASGAGVVRLAAAIQADVQQRFGVRLEPEPVFV